MSAFIYASSNYVKLIKGQTSIIRYNLTIHEPKSYDVTFIASSTFEQDQVEFQRIYISNVGENLPCTSYVAKMSTNTPAGY